MPLQFSTTLIDQIIKGRCTDFADLMGCTRTQAGQQRMTVFMPGIKKIDVVSSNGKKLLASLQQVHGEGLFCALVEARKAPAYRLRIECPEGTRIVDDPYRFGRCLDESELHLFSQGRHESAWELMGAHQRTVDGVEGVHFVLWAPLARRVSLLLPQYGWDGRVLLLYPHPEQGLWEIFVPGLQDGTAYKFEVMNQNLDTSVLRCDPFAIVVRIKDGLHSEVASTVLPEWSDHFWQMARNNHLSQSMPLTIHELGLNTLVQQGSVHWAQVAGLLLPAVKQQGFTHLLMRDVVACCSKGKQKQTALIAAASALGNLTELQRFIDEAHEAELGLLWDFPLMALFESHGITGTQIATLDWSEQGGMLASLMIACIDYWHRHLHVDGFRLRELDVILQGQQNTSRSKTKTAATSECNPFAREWLGFVLQQLRERFPALLLIVDTALPLPELTLSPRKSGMGADYRYGESRQLPLGSEVPPGKQISQLLSLWQDGNIRHQLVRWQPAMHSDVIMQQLLLLALWTLPARKLMQLDLVLKAGCDWQPEAGHDYKLESAPALTASTVELLQFLNHFYPQNHSLHELDSSHEGTLVLQADDDICIYERQSRHGLDAVLIVLNFSAEAKSGLQLHLGCNRHYRLLRQVNAVQYLQELHTTRTRAAAGCTAILDLLPQSGAIYELVTTA